MNVDRQQKELHKAASAHDGKRKKYFERPSYTLPCCIPVSWPGRPGTPLSYLLLNRADLHQHNRQKDNATHLNSYGLCGDCSDPEINIDLFFPMPQQLAD